MVQTFIKRLENRFYLGEITYPTRVRIDIASQIDCYSERMPMQSAALVALWYVGETMCRLEGKLFENFQNLSTLKMAIVEAVHAVGEFISNGLADALNPPIDPVCG